MSDAFEELAPDERELAGAWIETERGPVGDEVDRRIFWLVSRRLERRGAADGGWDQLYRDPRDGRLWELTFPSGSVVRGGPRRLRVISPEEAAGKYGRTDA